MIARCRRVRCERVAGCEVAVSHLAKFGDCKVRCPGVAPCDLFLIILSEIGGNAKVNTNVFRSRVRERLRAIVGSLERIRRVEGNAPYHGVAARRKSVKSPCSVCEMSMARP